MSREVQGGINWIWYFTKTKKDAVAWFKELTGATELYGWEVCKCHNGKWGFRLHR